MRNKLRFPQLNEKQKETAFYLSLAVILLCFFLLGRGNYVICTDSAFYMRVIIGREGVVPVYPLFLLMSELIFGSGYLTAVVVEQALLAVICILTMVGVFKKRFALPYWQGYLIAAFAVLPFTMNLPATMTTQEIMTEGIGYAVFYLFMAALLKAVWDKSYLWLGVMWGVSLFLSLVRSQLQILFVVCWVICIYVIALRNRPERTGGKIARLLAGTVAGALVCIIGIVCTMKINNCYQRLVWQDNAFTQLAVRVQEDSRSDTQEDSATQTQSEKGSVQSEETAESEEAAEIDETVEYGETPDAEEAADTGEQMAEPKQPYKTSQYVTLVFSRGMYEADYEDYKLFEDELLQELFLALYEGADSNESLYTYAKPGLWMWRDVAASIGQVGIDCFAVQNDFYGNVHPQISRDINYSDIRNGNQLKIGFTLLKAHFGRFLYHTLVMLPQGFICTVFFQIAPIYFLCHMVTLFLYISALGLMIWAYRNRNVENEYAETMCAVLGTNLVMVVVISLVFFGQQRYLVYTFGLFYIAYFLLLTQLWKQYGGMFLEKMKAWKKRKKS